MKKEKSADIFPRKQEELFALRSAIMKNGFGVVPVNNAVPGKPDTGKNCFDEGWQIHARQRQIEQVQTWTDDADWLRKMNTGVLCTGLYSFDIDIDDHQLAEQIAGLIESRLGKTIMRTRSNTKRVLLVYNAASGEPRKKSVGNRGTQVEVLGAGNFFVGFGKHHSGGEIGWRDNQSPANTTLSSLPSVFEQEVTDLLVEIGELLGTTYVKALPAPVKSPSNGSLGAYPMPTAADVLECLNIIPVRGMGYKEWANVAAACFNSNGEFADFDAWSRGDLSNYGAQACVRQWNNSKNLDCDFGYLTNLVRRIDPTFRKTAAEKSQIIAQNLAEMAITTSAISQSIASDSTTDVTAIGSNSFSISNGKLFFYKNSERMFIANQFEIVGKSTDINSEGWAYIIKWRDLRGNVHQERIPFSALGTEQTDIFKKLRSGGLMIGEGKAIESIFKRYLNEASSDRIILSVTKPGWTRDSYLLPDGTKFGNDDIALDVTSTKFNAAGDIATWKQEVAARACGNTHLMFSICVGLASPLIHINNSGSGGFHMYGDAQIGKTSAMEIGASVISNPDRLGTWRATDNGMEVLAASCNDRTLFLDELGQLPERANPGEIVYMLGNGEGKSRSSKDIQARDVLEWRLLYLSTGEHDLSAECAKKNVNVKAGHLVRLADIPMDNINVKNLHGFSSPRELVETMKRAAKSHYGHAGRAFIQRLVNVHNEDKAGLQASLKAFIKQFVIDHAPSNANNQIVSVAERFALVAYAGEMAIANNILPWQADTACIAVAECLRVHLEARGTNAAFEIRDAVSKVRSFIQKHQFDRFADPDIEGRIFNCAGYKDKDGFYIYPHVFKDEIFKGDNAAGAAKKLLDYGFLIKHPNEKHMAKKKRFSASSARYYTIDMDILDCEN